MKVAEISLDLPIDGNYNVICSDGTNWYNVGDIFVFNPGTYYLAVQSVDGTFSQINSYTLEVKTILDNSLVTCAYTDDLKTVLQYDGSSENYYLNGNEIDFSYSYENHISNSAGYIDTYLNLYPGSNPKIVVTENESHILELERPEFIDYTTNFVGGESKERVLKATVYNITKADVSRYAGGAYDGQDAHYFKYYSVIIIDPETGEVIDMVDPNYYYDYGNQSYSFIRYPYNTVLPN